VAHEGELFPDAAVHQDTAGGGIELELLHAPGAAGVLDGPLHYRVGHDAEDSAVQPLLFHGQKPIRFHPRKSVKPALARKMPNELGKRESACRPWIRR
jgi:hypothetical protein